ncbi:MAG: AlpA family phage regulatory protein [Rhodomicrobium sp.]
MENALARPRLIRRPEVLAQVGLRTTALYDLIKRGKFPKPVRLGKRAVAWVQAEVDAWIVERAQTRFPHEGKGARQATRRSPSR